MFYRLYVKIFIFLLICMHCVLCHIMRDTYCTEDITKMFFSFSSFGLSFKLLHKNSHTEKKNLPTPNQILKFFMFFSIASF